MKKLSDKEIFHRKLDCSWTHWVPILIAVYNDYDTSIYKGMKDFNQYFQVVLDQEFGSLKNDVQYECRFHKVIQLQIWLEIALFFKRTLAVLF